MPAPSVTPEGQVKFEKTEIEVMQCSTVDAIIRETERGARVCALNFASYKNPGGMFTDGSTIGRRKAYAMRPFCIRSYAPTGCAACFMTATREA